MFCADSQTEFWLESSCTPAQLGPYRLVLGRVFMVFLCHAARNVHAGFVNVQHRLLNCLPR